MTSPNAKRTAKRKRDTREWRMNFVATIERCEYCGRRGNLCLHEVARGIFRSAALDKPFALIGVHHPVCHDLVAAESVPRQLARIYLHRQRDYDRVAFNRLRCQGDDAISHEAVMKEVDAILNPTGGY
jgi:ribosomal protein S14